MFPPTSHLPESPYSKYKRLGRSIFGKLDPNGLLRGVKHHRAKQIVQNLVRKLADNLRDTVSTELLEAIRYRTEWAKCYKRAPKYMQANHKTYIDFLKDIQKQLSAYKADEPAALAKEEQPPTEPQPEEDEEKGGSADDEETGLTSEQAGDAETHLTLDHADFLVFLASLMALAREAAKLWEEVARDKLPIWTASTLTNILLHEADSLIQVTRLLDEEDSRDIQPSGSLKPWATSAGSVNGGVSKPQLAQDWVNAMDQMSGTEFLWRELTALLPKISSYQHSFLVPPFRVAADAFQSKHRPYFFDMLLHGCSVLSLNGHPTSVADVPLATLVAVYFCHLVTGKDNDGMSNKVDLEAARKEACAEMNETLAILPRLYKQKALTEEQMETFRSTAGQMKAWAKACSEPMSLGAIHAFARVHRVSWHTRVTGCNSVPLQIFLYLCEKRRLQVPQSSTGSGDYERLIGALLEDQRVAPYLLKDGRPTTVRQCIEALRSWCHQPTSNGETRDVDWTLEDKNLKMVERSSKVRNSSFLFLDIAANDYCVTKDMYARLSTKEGMDNLAGGTPLERYLVWEMGPPSCLKLEAALFKAVQKTSEWEELRVATLLNTIQNKSEWVNAVGNVLRDVLQTLPELESFESFGCFTLETSFQIALLKVVLNVSGHKETLKAALVNAFRFIPWWRNLYADSLLEWAMPKWQKIHRNFKIEILSRSLEVNSLACIEYLIPPYKDWNKGKETRNQVVGQLLEGFMEEARSILEEAYGDIER